MNIIVSDLDAVVVKSLHTCTPIMGMRVMVILYFFEIPGWNNYTSYIFNDLKKKTWCTRLNLLQSVHTPPVISDEISLSKLYINQTSLVV